MQRTALPRIYLPDEESRLLEVAVSYMSSRVASRETVGTVERTESRWNSISL